MATDETRREPPISNRNRAAEQIAMEGIASRSAADAAGSRVQSADVLPEGALGGTSDAGSAADEAAENAAFGRGTEDDRTR